MCESVNAFCFCIQILHDDTLGVKDNSLSPKITGVKDNSLRLSAIGLN